MSELLAHLPARVLLPTAFLPPVQWWAHWLASPVAVIEAHENYQKRGYRNRCHLVGPNGELTLTVPLLRGKHEQQPIQEVQIAYHTPWPRQHWQSICTAYGSAPFFDFYTEPLRDILLAEPLTLWSLNDQLLHWLRGELAPERPIVYTTHYQPAPPPGELDLRTALRPGRTVAEDKWFKAPYYGQLFRERHGFIGNLSILDLLFCTGPQARNHLLASLAIAK